MVNDKSIKLKMSLSEPEPPEYLSVYAKSLWLSAKGNWKAAHELVQDLDDRSAALIHAYLHRVEGDHSNAKYWYAKANEKMPAVDLNTEWELLARRFT
jgi:hypothetical protein